MIDSVSKGTGVGRKKEVFVREAVQIQPTRIRRKHTKPGYKNTILPETRGNYGNRRVLRRDLCALSKQRWEFLGLFMTETPKRYRQLVEFAKRLE